MSDFHSLPNPIFIEPVFQEGKPLPNPKGFHVPHPSDEATYAQLGELLKIQTTPIPPARGPADSVYSLATAFGDAGPAVVQQILSTGQIQFHAVGDTGSSSSKNYSNEIRAADAMVMDFHASPQNPPAFFYHLGDLVYNFGESKYYYDEFYEPYRNYPRPIFAIPGNHDSFVVPGTSAGSQPLDIFQRNFCSQQFNLTPEAYSLHRTAVTQPGVYFTLDAPFVRLIGLFSNALEDPGLISSQAGQWPHVSDLQLDFMRAQLTRAKNENYRGALIVATHHPAFTYLPQGGAGNNHGGSDAMLREIDTICASVGVYPHAFLSGHVHNYQRYTRQINFASASIEVPFVICGNGGHNVLPIVDSPTTPPAFGTDTSYLDLQPAVTATRLTLEKYDDQHYGYLLITASTTELRIDYHSTAAAKHSQSKEDSVVIDLKSHRRVTP